MTIHASKSKLKIEFQYGGRPFSETRRTAKINFINSGALDIIRTVYYIHKPELMKLIFAVLYVL